MRAETSWVEESRELAMRGGLHGGQGARAIWFRNVHVASASVRAGALGMEVFKGRVRWCRKDGHWGSRTRALDAIGLGQRVMSSRGLGRGSRDFC